MTLFAILCALAGLSQHEAGDLCGVRHDSARQWATGRRTAPPATINELRALIVRQEHAASEAVAQIAWLSKSHSAPDVIELGYPADDHEAQSLGWPCVGAWSAMAARVIAAAPAKIVLVPRGSTPGTAAAADAHGR